MQELRYQGRNGHITDFPVNSPKHAFIYMLISLDDTKFIIRLGSSFFIGLFYEVLLLNLYFTFETKKSRTVK